MRNLLQTIKRWHFWVLCPLLLLLATVVWFLGVGGLKKQVGENRNTINGLYNSVDSVRNVNLHPNQDIAQGMDALIEKRRSEVAKAWTEKYHQQTADDGTLAWPEELGKKFIGQVKDLRPIEKKVDFPVQNDLVLDDRMRYQEHLATELPKLAKRIGAKWFLEKKDDASMMPVERMGDAGRPPRGQRGDLGGMQTFGQGGETLADQALVDWSAKSQMEILAEHFPWGYEGITSGMQSTSFRDGYVPTGTTEPYPNLLEILYAQEDLWVLQAIMNVIARTNEGATARFNALVKEIEFIRMGKSAVQSNGRIKRLSGGAEASTGDSYGQGGMETTGAAGGEQSYDGGHGSGAGHGEGEDEQFAQGPKGPDPAEGRYVDEQYARLSATQLRQVMRDFQAVDPSLAYLAVAKRIPVRFRVKLDQTGLDRLLTECANSPLTIEVRQVRINPDDDGSSGGMDLMGSGMGDVGRGNMGDAGRRTIRIEGPMRSNLPGGGLSGAEAIDAQSTTDVTAEIYGIVYIYNPVDEQVLGTTTSEG